MQCKAKVQVEYRLALAATLCIPTPSILNQRPSDRLHSTPSLGAHHPSIQPTAPTASHNSVATSVA